MFERVEELNSQIHIRGLVDRRFLYDLKNYYGNSRIARLFSEKIFSILANTVVTPIFFALEVYFICQELYSKTHRQKYAIIMEELRTHTWLHFLFKETVDNPTADLSLLRDFQYSLKPYQLEFLKDYESKKSKLQLHGYILAYEQGLGKTLTSVALMHCMKKDLVIVIAPKSSLRTVWKNELEAYFKEKPEVFVFGDKILKPNTRYVVVNYENIDKIIPIISKLKFFNLGIIVDESHNFKTFGNKRVSDLVDLQKNSHCKDLLLMSGTPIKALGAELIPALTLLDPKFDESAMEVFKSVFGVNVPVALSIVKHRMGFMMIRKLKSEVLNLPEKKYKEIKISIPNSQIYTIPVVKEKLAIFMKGRMEFYLKDIDQYRDRFFEILDYFRKNNPRHEFELDRYMRFVQFLKRAQHHGLKELTDKEKEFIRKFEKNVLEPSLPSEMKKEFRKIKSVVKYVYLKVMGETMGELQHLRRDMYAEIIKKSADIFSQVIKESIKKTVMFTTYVDVLVMANEEIKKRKFNPIIVYGQNVSERDGLVKAFKEEPDKNPLIATIQTLSTAVTLVEANTVIFINSPWRSVDKAQAEDRVHRIGQDTEVFIYTVVLDTGKDKNLSTRLEEIVEWSKEMFEAMVGEGTDAEKEQIKIEIAARLSGSRLQ